MDAPSPLALASLVLTAPGWVRVGIAAPNKSTREAAALGGVCIYRSQIMAHARCTKPMKAEIVFSQRKAIRRKRLSLLKKHST